MDKASIHYLSELSCYLEPLHIIEMRQKSKELKLQLENELKFTEELYEKGLLETYIKMKLGVK